MAFRFSTGLRNGMLNATGLKEAMTNGVLRIYTGAQPATADTAASGSLLLEVTVNAGAFAHGSPTNGLNFDAPSSGIISKAVAEVWRGNGLTDGTAGWFRFCANPVDAGGSSTTLARIDGTCAKTGGDAILSTTAIVTGAPVTVDEFQITFSAG